MNVTGVVWMGVRTAAYPALRRLFGTTMGLETTHESEGVAWFRLPGGEEIQIYSDADVDHTFFGSGPVIGFEVDDVVSAVATLVGAGIELVGDGDAADGRRWQHFRGPDGNIYEVIGPAD